MDNIECNRLHVKANDDVPITRSSLSSQKQVLKTIAIPLTPLDRMYEGSVGGFLTLKSRIHLRISTTGLVNGEVRRIQEENVDAIDNCNGKKRKRRVISDHIDGIVIAHVVGNGQIVPIEEEVELPSSKSSDDNVTSAVEYCCTFDVMKRLHHVDRHTLTCHLHVPMTPDAPAVGTWRFSKEDEQTRQPVTSTMESRKGEMPGSIAEQKVFQLEPVQWCQSQQEVERTTQEAEMMPLLCPLRPGKYEFKGFTTYNKPSDVAAAVPRQRNGRRSRPRPVMTTMKDKCWVTLYLLPDGTLHGTSREVAQPQVCELKGRWYANRVAYVLEYRVREAVGHFRYSGAVVIEEGHAGVQCGKQRSKKAKGKSKANASGKRREILSGKWHNVDEDHEDGHVGGRGEFELELERVNFTPTTLKTEKNDSNGDIASRFQQEQRQMHHDIGRAKFAAVTNDDDDAIHVFTSGVYELSGCTSDTDGYEYPFELKVQLRPGGMLLGESKERIFQQVSPVFGCWGPSRIEYGQQYVVKHEVGMYTYTADISRDGAVLQGTWANVEADSASDPSEHGTVALILVNSTRRWSTFSHAHYPLRFRQGVLTTLMASARMRKLPGVLWTHIFAFCSETWFTPSRQRRHI
ncbi:unnamed protein product [Peronospora effusa]|nr:unnamed protein product [Peronospora effusa]